MTADHDAVRRLLGAYVLGGLDDTDQHTVDAHLSTCAECRTEVGRLAAVPELLQRLSPAAPGEPLQPPSRAGLDAFLRRARPRRLPVIALAAACLVLAVLVGFLAVGRPSPTIPPQAAGSPSASAAPGTVVEFEAAAGSALSGKATLSPRQWGVSVSLELAGLPGEGPFTMQVLDRGGQTEQAACWGRTQTAQARVTGASSIQLANVGAIQIADHDGHLLGSARLA